MHVRSFGVAATLESVKYYMKVGNERGEKVIMSTHFNNSIFADYNSWDINDLDDFGDETRNFIEFGDKKKCYL